MYRYTCVPWSPRGPKAYITEPDCVSFGIFYLVEILFGSYRLELKAVNISVHLARTEGLRMWKQMRVFFFKPFGWFVAWKMITHCTSHLW